MEGATALFRLLDDKLLLVVLAITLVLFNAVLHAFKEWFTDRYKRRADDNATVDRELRPLLHATTDLVSRLLELLLQTGSRMQQQHWKPLENNACVDVLSLDRLQSTTIRFISFLALRERFRSHTNRISSERLERIRFYVDRKIPTALKGNIFAAEILSNEAAEACGEFFQPAEASQQITTLCLLEKVNSDAGRGLFNAIGGSLAINLQKLQTFVATDQSPVDIDFDVRRILALAHFAIMLLDFQQDVSQTPHWEENRIVLCKMLVKYNRAREKAAFLYSHGDLASADYLDSYSPYVTGETPQERSGFVAKRRIAKVLAQRGKWTRQSHPVKVIDDQGVKSSMGKSNVELFWTDDLSTLVQKLNTYLLSTRKLISVSPNVSGAK